MRHETQAVAALDRRTKTDGVRSHRAPRLLNSLGGGVVELPLLVPAETAATLEAVAYERGLTVAQLTRLLIRDFLASASDDGAAAALIRNKYSQGSLTEEDVVSFQRGCLHPSARWVQSGCHESLVCERCRAVLEEGWPDHHPEISRWLNEGGASTC